MFHGNLPKVLAGLGWMLLCCPIGFSGAVGTTKRGGKVVFFVELLEGTFQGVVKVGDPMSSIYFGDLQGPFQ
jgi:hypothetical protein